MMMSGFSNLMGYGITKLDGVNGLAAWRWIFIIFGVVTMGLGFIGYFLIGKSSIPPSKHQNTNLPFSLKTVDFPDKAAFLTEDERALILLRIDLDRGDALPDGFTGRKILSHMGDYELWLYGLCFCFTTLPTYA